MKQLGLKSETVESTNGINFELIKNKAEKELL